MTPQRFTGKIALVTGATRGIGRAVALALAREGAHVVALGRTQGALEELDDDIKAQGGAATLVRLELRKGADIDALGPSLYQRWQRLDILVGNAAVLGPMTPIGHLGDAEWNDVIAINLTANMRLIRTLDPLMRKADAARALFVSSGVARSPRALWGAYATSKAALECLVKTYASEVANTAVRVNLVNPGATRTAMRASAMPGEDPLRLPAPEEIAPRCLELLLPSVTANGEVFDVSPLR